MSTATNDLGVLITLAYSAFKERLHAYLAGAGYDDLGPSYGFVFRSLAEHSLSLVELATRLGITPQGALKIVAEMEARGYVERQEDAADRRVRRLVLTTRARDALGAARRFHATTERALAQRLGRAQVAGARAVLADIAGDLASSDALWAGVARPF